MWNKFKVGDSITTNYPGDVISIHKIISIDDKNEYAFTSCKIFFYKYNKQTGFCSTAPTTKDNPETTYNITTDSDKKKFTKQKLSGWLYCKNWDTVDVEKLQKIKEILID